MACNSIISIPDSVKIGQLVQTFIWETQRQRCDFILYFSFSRKQSEGKWKPEENYVWCLGTTVTDEFVPVPNFHAMNPYMWRGGEFQRILSLVTLAGDEWSSEIAGHEAIWTPRAGLHVAAERHFWLPSSRHFTDFRSRRKHIHTHVFILLRNRTKWRQLLLSKRDGYLLWLWQEVKTRVCCMTAILDSVCIPSNPEPDMTDLCIFLKHHFKQTERSNIASRDDVLK
jgi:hypothetical protein